jgi:hypothetical protein
MTRRVSGENVNEPLNKAEAPIVVPAGFEVIAGEKGEIVIARASYGPWIRSGALADPEALLQKGDGGAEAQAPAGRGVIARVRADGNVHLVLKKYRRGGLLAPALPDLFATFSRMESDLAASERLRERGLPCAAAAALIFGAPQGPLRRVYLLTEEIEGTVALDRALHSANEAGRKVDFVAAREAVLAVRRMHEAGVIHGDLNVRNLLLRGAVVFIIDLDGAMLPASVTPGLRFANLSRLDRSYVKTFGDEGPLSCQSRQELMADYCAGDRALLADFESRVAAHKRSVRRHALLWSNARP